MVYYVDHSKAVVLLFSYFLCYVCRIVSPRWAEIPGSFALLYSSSVYTSQFVNSSCVLGSFSDTGNRLNIVSVLYLSDVFRIIDTFRDLK